MSSSSIDETASSILEFQANIVRTTYRRKISPVDPDVPKIHDALDFIWQCARIDDSDGDSVIVGSSGTGGVGLGVRRGVLANTEKERWVKIGFGTEHIRQEFAKVGILGLECLVSTLNHADPLSSGTLALTIVCAIYSAVSAIVRVA